MVGTYAMENKYLARNAIILARVSSKDQEEGYSIEAQAHRGTTYCGRHNLRVLKTFELVESSTQGDRQQFMLMIDFVKNHKEPIAIVADKIDRVQRSFKEYPLLDELIQKGKIELHFVTENSVIHRDSRSQERQMWGFGVLMAQAYIDSMRDNVKRSIDQKLRLGEWIAQAPIGYLNIRDDRDRSNIIVDPERAPLIIKMFEEFAKGTYTVRELAQKCKKWGLKSRSKGAYLGKSKIYQMINNPFYYGRMIVKGHSYEHRYPPLINKQLFDQCQAVLKGWHLKPFKWGDKEFLFRGLLTCATTGRVVTAETKKKTYASGAIGMWTYLRCHNPEKPEKFMWIREDAIMKQIENIFKNIAIPDHTLSRLLTYMRKTDQTERNFLKRQMIDLQREHEAIQTRLDGLMDLLLDGVIDRKEFENKKNKLRDQQITVEWSMSSHREGDDGFKKAIISLIEVLSNAYNVFIGSDLGTKRELLNFMFQNLSLKGETLCYSYRKPFDMMADVRTFEEWRPLVDSLRTCPQMRVCITQLQSTFLQKNNQICH